MSIKTVGLLTTDSFSAIFFSSSVGGQASFCALKRISSAERCPFKYSFKSSV